MPLTAHDRRIIQLAARSPEGRLSFHLDEDGSAVLTGPGEGQPLPAEDSLPRLQQLGLLTREVNRSYVLTPAGWEVARDLDATESLHPFNGRIGA